MIAAVPTFFPSLCCLYIYMCHSGPPTIPTAFILYTYHLSQSHTPDHFTMASSTSDNQETGKQTTRWFISQNAVPCALADQEAKDTPGPNAGLLTVPFFHLPNPGQMIKVKDIDNQFSSEALAKFLEDEGIFEGSTSEFWYACFPGDYIRAIAVRIQDAELALVSRFTTDSMRYIITLVE